MKEILHFLSYIAALLRINFRAHHGNLRRTLMLGGFMFTQNLMFFTMWIVFFGSIRQVKGWQLGDVGLMFGTIATACGFSMFVADGVRTIGQKIQDGSIDGFLTRPRHALPALLLSRSNAAALGDILSGPVYWFFFGGASASHLPGILALTVLSAIVFLSALVVFYSLPFWLQRSGRFSDQLFEVMIIFSSIPQHAQSLGVKMFMFSILPAGFISFIPVSLLHHFNWQQLLILIIATLMYVWTALTVFNAGVRRYVAANT